MKVTSAVVLLTSLWTVAVAADGNFAYLATASITGADHLNAYTSSISSYVASLTAQPAFSSFVDECLSVSSPDDAVRTLARADCNPFELATLAANPTTTPAWFTEIPKDMQSYVGNVASFAESAAQKINGDKNAAGESLFINFQALILSLAMSILAML